MPGTTLNAAEMAEQLGRKDSWLHDNWRTLVAEKRIPPPLLGGAAPVVWDRAQVLAFKDRALTRPEQVAAAAYRAAREAADNARLTNPARNRVVRDRAELDARFEV